MTLPNFTRSSTKVLIKKALPLVSERLPISEKMWSYITLFLATFCLTLLLIVGTSQGQKLISPLVAPLQSLTDKQVHKGHEVFGFAPYWKINDLDNVDFNILTTFSYFGVPVSSDGSLDRSDYGYTVFQSKKATEIFRKAHQHGTRVVLTITQMDNDTIDAFLANPQAQETTIQEAVAEVKNRGIDGINVDFEYVGNPGSESRAAFSDFVTKLTSHMHQEVPASRVTVSVYASAASKPKLYDIAAVAEGTDGIFMMAYDFAVAGSEVAMPTAPLYGKKEGKYNYDVSSAVDEFLALMPADKLILGVPYYGYNYMVYQPGINEETRPASWRGRSTAQTYEYALNNLTPEKEGWDDVGKVGWQAYVDPDTGTWRILFLDDARSLSYKYDFALEKGLEGVGMWALGFDNGKSELWDVLRQKFGAKPIADNRIVSRLISDTSIE